MNRNFLVLFLFLIKVFLSCINITSSVVIETAITDKDSFFVEIRQKKSYQHQLFDDYYEKFQQGYSIVESLNMINHPNFYNGPVREACEYNGILLVNKSHQLNNTYIPPLVVVEKVSYIKRLNETMMINQEALSAYRALEREAKNLGINLVLFSAYRSYSKQVELFSSGDPNYVAAPGQSEHQTGLAIDVSTMEYGLSIHLENTIVETFIREVGPKHGFILRYPKNRQTITGFMYEPWHLRYVGSLSTQIQEYGTLEEYIYKNIEIL